VMTALFSDYYYYYIPSAVPPMVKQYNAQRNEFCANAKKKTSLLVTYSPYATTKRSILNGQHYFLPNDSKSCY